ncbi:MAG: hypothetical protein RI935_752 [Candidatus Parcubacteria bacterium]
MLQKIDDRCINIAQRFITAMEIRTPFSRNNVISFGITLLKVLLVIGVVIALLSAYFVPKDFIVLVIAGILLMFPWADRLDMRKHIESSDYKNHSGLPRAIMERVSPRLFFFVTMIYKATIYPVIIYRYYHHSEHEVQRFLMMGLLFDMVVVYITTLCTEYLLCTTGLPPKEREARGKAEVKRNGNMLPLGA